MKEAIARYSFGSTFGQGALICSSISFWIGSAWIYTILQGVDFPTCNTIAIVSFAVMPVFIALALTSKMGFMLIGASLAVGISLGAAHACAMNTPHGDGGIPTADYVFTLSEDSVINDYGATAHAFLNVNNQSIRVRLHFLNDSNLLAGCKIHARTTLMDVDVSTLESYWNNGECYKAYIREYSIVDDDGITSSMRFLREDSLEFIDDHADNPTILKAITCGSRNSLYESPEYDAIRLSGLAHLVAVSGAHLTIVASMMGVLLRALRSPRFLSIAITIALMSFYYLLAGTPISAFRALVMAVLATSSFYVQRRAYSLNALGTSIFVIICFDFYASLSISFLLSALATLGIILFAPSISEALYESVKVVPKAIIETVSVTISALLTVQPVSCALFSQLPTLSIFANLFAAIVFPLSCSFGIIGILFHFISNEIGGIFLSLAAQTTHALTFFAENIAAIPWACLSVELSIEAAILITLGIAISYSVIGTYRQMLIMLTIIATSLTIACICIYSIQQNEDYLLMVDVGQGDAFIVRSNHITALIDTGNNGYKLRNACSRLGIRHFDYVVITHRDDDHCGALGYISQFIDIDCIVLAQQISFESNDACRQLNILSNEIAKGVMYVFPGDSIQVGDITLHVLWPYSFKDAGGNEDSICLYGEFDDLSDKTIEASMLFTGDLESQELKSIVEKSSISDIDILKVGHHGSANSLDSEILSVLEPRIALIGVGNGNRYGHPDSETIALLDRADAHVFRSDEYGCVKCSLSSQGIEVRSVIQ